MSGIGKYSVFANVKLCTGESDRCGGAVKSSLVLCSVLRKYICFLVVTVIAGQMFLPKLFFFFFLAR